MHLLLTLWLSISAQALSLTPELFGSPALLLDYRELKHAENFNRPDSGTLAFRQMVEILYDADNGRPWGSEYFPVVNRTLAKVRSDLCPTVNFLNLCVTPAIIWNARNVAEAQAALMNPGSLAILSKKWDMEIMQWKLPLRLGTFSLVVGQRGEPEMVKADYWQMRARDVRWLPLRQIFVSDKDNYRAGFDSKDFPALFAHSGPEMRWNDWLLRTRAMEFAQQWRHNVRMRDRQPAPSPIFDTTAVIHQAMARDQAADFEKKYSELRALVSGEHLARFEKERAEGNYPEEVFQHIAYRNLKNLMQVQGNYLSQAMIFRRKTSERQQVLESLLTMQRYSASPQMLAAELTTLSDPISSHASVLDAMADASIAHAFILEQLKALLGQEVYAGKALFPALGKGLLQPELLNDDYLKEYAPDIREKLAGRTLVSLETKEQIEILTAYLQPQPGKVRPQALFRMGLLVLSSSSAEDLRKLAEAVHEARKANFN